MQLDLASAESISKAAEEAAKLLPDGLDTLLGNAGTNDQPDETFENLFVVPLNIDHRKRTHYDSGI